MPLNPPLNQVSLPSYARAENVSGLKGILASQNKLSLMGVRQGELRERRGEGKERAVKTQHMRRHASPSEESSSMTASDITSDFQHKLQWQTLSPFYSEQVKTVTVIGKNQLTHVWYTQTWPDRQVSKHTHLWQNTDMNTHSWYAPEHWSCSAFLMVQCSGLINYKGSSKANTSRKTHTHTHTVRGAVSFTLPWREN